jgi:penicillin-binding protein 1A
MAAFQMVHILEGVVERGTATVLARPRPASVRQDRHDQRPDQRLVRRRYAGHRRRRLRRLRPAAADGPWRAGRSDRRADLQGLGAGRASRTCRRSPFVAPAGIRWVRVDRGSGRRVFGTFPTEVDPRSPVIWEAFQPQTEPRRSFRRRGQGDEDWRPIHAAGVGAAPAGRRAQHHNGAATAAAKPSGPVA